VVRAVFAVAWGFLVGSSLEAAVVGSASAARGGPRTAAVQPSSHSPGGLLGMARAVGASDHRPRGTLAQQDREPSRPYKEAREAPLEYRGAGRELPEPEVDEVVLGWFGPGDPDDPVGGEFWRGALLAQEELNAAGGDRGRPFRLVPGWSENPWGTGVVQVTKMVYEHGAWAILGAIDGAATHLAEQVALKARVTLLSTGSTDVTANMASVPWMFSCLPSDEAQAPVVAAAVADAAQGGAFAIAAAAEHDAHAALVELRQALFARRLTPASLLEFDPVELDLDPLAARLREASPHAVVVLAPPLAGARLVVALRRQGFSGRLIGGPTLALNAFARAAGESAEGVVVPRLWEPTPRWDSFARMYENRWGGPPDHAAAQSYDAVRLVADALRRAGLNRARIRDAVRDLSPWRGVAGIVRWDALGRNERPVGLARWTAGRLQPIVTPEQ
jgi:branched-chain amino acid transport system substrate-binding protein